MNIQGQMLDNSERGIILKKIIKTYEPKNIVEIGTWKGLGSTKCILDEIDNTTNFYSVESNKEFYEIAKNNLKEYIGKFNLIYGKIVEVEDIMKFTSTITLNEQQNVWLSSDINDIKKCENIFHILPKKINFLLLDGGEFSTYSEWLKLRDITEIVALDDINSLKCEKIFNELKNDKNYDMLELTNEGNGFSVFKKKV